MSAPATISKALNLTRVKFYETHLAIINGLLPIRITPKEIEVLARFMSFSGDLSTARFGTTARKMVKQALGLSDGGLGNYLRALKEKGFIAVSENPPYELTINPLLIPNPDRQEYRFLLTNIDHDTPEEEPEVPHVSSSNGSFVKRQMDHAINTAY